MLYHRVKAHIGRLLECLVPVSWLVPESRESGVVWIARAQVQRLVSQYVSQDRQTLFLQTGRPIATQRAPTTRAHSTTGQQHQPSWLTTTLSINHPRRVAQPCLRLSAQQTQSRPQRMRFLARRLRRDQSHPSLCRRARLPGSMSASCHPSPRTQGLLCPRI